MSTAGNAETWVAYRKTVRGRGECVNAVCTQSEWDAMELAFPGEQPLIQAGMRSEAETERLARGTSGDSPERRAGARLIATEPPSTLGPSAPNPQSA